MTKSHLRRSPQRIPILSSSEDVPIHRRGFMPNDENGDARADHQICRYRKRPMLLEAERTPVRKRATRSKRGGDRTKAVTTSGRPSGGRVAGWFGSGRHFSGSKHDSSTSTTLIPRALPCAGPGGSACVGPPPPLPPRDGENQSDLVNRGGAHDLG